LSAGSCDVSGFVALLPDNDVKFDFLSISNGANQLLWIILNDGRLMNKHIFLGVRPIDKSIAALDVEPFYNTGHFSRNDFLAVVRSLVLVVAGLWLFLGLLLRVSHDVGWQVFSGCW